MSTAWIGPSRNPREDIGVFLFRTDFYFADTGEPVLVRLSADQRYRFYVNGHLVSHGPQRGDLEHWFYETVDLRPHLLPGENTLAAVVWNFGLDAPMAQMTLRTAFQCDADLPALCTPGNWEVAPVPSYKFERMTASPIPFYMEVGPGEIMDGRDFCAWPELFSGDHLNWQTPHVIVGLRPQGSVFESHWATIPASLPPMQYNARSARPIRRHGYEGDPEINAAEQAFEAGRGTSILLDNQELICAYPRLTLSGPANTVVTVTYDEALWEPEEMVGAYGTQAHKGNRNQVHGKRMLGYQDKVILGDQPVLFEPLWWRTYRYIRIESDGSPVRVESIQAMETLYPYQVESSFAADDPWVEPIWDVSIRTAKRCAGETYFDCPYYEQLQYGGDTRLQALIHYYLSTDRALPRNAVNQLGESLMSNGLLQSRYPNRVTQIIPPFCLWWVQMVRDQFLYDGDFLSGDGPQPNIEVVVNGFKKLRRSPSIGKFWAFGDWVPTWGVGVPPGNLDSTMHTMTLLLAELAVAELLHPEVAGDEILARYVAELRFDAVGLAASKNLPDEPPTQHAEALLRLARRQLGYPEQGWPQAELEAAQAPEPTLYFSYYKHQAMRADNYLDQLGPWKQMIEDGLTTFAETPEPSRSDCHAWSAHPILGFFQLIAGVTSTAVGWSRAQIAPNPGSLRRFVANIAHPLGALKVEFEDGRLKVDCPVPFELVWQGQSVDLAAGEHKL